MNDHYQNTLMSQFRQQELYSQAEQARLAAEADTSDAKPFYAPILNTVGHSLIHLGNSLQERYGEHNTVPPAANFASANK